MHWNGGGLSLTKLDEIKAWALTQCLDVLVLTETRWSWTNEWTDDTWSYVHVGSPADRSAGILIMTSKRLCTPSALRWHDVIPGRILHVQIRLTNRPIDVIAVYQHAMLHTKQRLQQRVSWWNTLDRYLGLLPKRHVLLLLGDFNCRLPTAKGHVGPELFSWQGALTTGSTHPDEGQFLDIVRAHGLSALSTWNSKLGPTYHHAQNCSRIDHCLTRQINADGVAKAIRLLNQAPFLGSLKTGHFPMLGQIRKFWIPPGKHSCATGISSQQRDVGHLADVAASLDWDQFMQSSTQALTKSLTQADPQDPDVFFHMHNTAIRHYAKFFLCDINLHGSIHMRKTPPSS